MKPIRNRKDNAPTQSEVSEGAVKEQVITDNYALYCSDCMLVLPTLQSESIDLSVYSPPFAGLYQYSSSDADFSNCETKEQFLEQYEFLIAEIARVTKPGRISAVHVTDIMGKDGDLWDFPGEVKKLHRKYGFAHRNTITIWKEPLKVRMRTMVKSLMHKLIVEDSTECFTAMPDYLLIFKKKGENKVPVVHPFGLTHYAGDQPFLKAHEETYGPYEAFKKKWENYTGDPKGNKLSHLTWQRYASSVWDDARIDNVLPFRDARDEDDEKHVHPLQLDVIDRIVDLYSNPGEVVLTPFAGVGSEVYSPVSMGRKAIGIELKDSYFKQMVLNVRAAEARFLAGKPRELFDEPAEALSEME
jgi:DNA modification methylase